MLQIVATQDIFDPIDTACLLSSGVFAKYGQASLSANIGFRKLDDLDLVDNFVLLDALPEHPQQFAQFGSIAAVSLLSSAGA